HNGVITDEAQTHQLDIRLVGTR
ncbi:MAG: lipo-like protein, partial [Vibrio alginolyticus]